MAHVFISYSHKDNNFALELKQKLLDKGFPVWIDEHISGGQRWRDEIDQKLWEAFAVVLVLTPDAVESQYVNYEWIFALGAGAEVIPVYLKDIKQFPYRLDDIQYIDFRMKYSWEELDKKLYPLQLGYISHEPVRQAINYLNDPEPVKRHHGIDTLINLNAADELANAVKHSNRSVRIDAAFALCQVSNFQDSRALPGLFIALEDPEWSLRVDAAKALGKIRHLDAVPRLLMATRDSSGDVQYAAVEALGLMSSVEAIPVLLNALRNSAYRTVQHAASIALAKIGAEALSGLVEILSTNGIDAQARIGAAYALGEIGDSRALPELHNALYSKNPELQISTIKAIGKISDVSSLPALMNILDKDDDYLSDHIAKSIAQIGKPTTPTLVDALKNKNSNIRKVAIEALGEIGDSSHLVSLVNVLDDPNLEVSNAAIPALTRLIRLNPSIEIQLIELLSNKEYISKWNGLMVILGNIESRNAVPRLTAILEMNHSIDMSIITINVLGEIADPSTINLLAGYLSDQRVGQFPLPFGYIFTRTISDAAEKALRKIGTPEALAAVEKWRREQGQAQG